MEHLRPGSTDAHAGLVAVVGAPVGSVVDLVLGRDEPALGTDRLRVLGVADEDRAALGARVRLRFHSFVLLGLVHGVDAENRPPAGLSTPRGCFCVKECSPASI